MNYLNLSFHDLLQMPDFKLAAKLDDKNTLNRILHNLGMDVEKGYTINKCLHRALTTNIPQDCDRVEGFERVDSDWLKSGYASLDSIIYSTSDSSLKDELLSLNPDNYEKKDCDEDLIANVEVESNDEYDLFEPVETEEGDCV